jgi:drug/metabolite transporter (DMT)-like permease
MAPARFALLEVLLPDPHIDPPVTVEQSGLAERWRALPGNVWGAVLFVIASAIFSVMIALIKLAGERLHVTEILFFRQFIMTAIAAPAIWAGWPDSLHSARPRLQVVRVGLAFMAMTLGFAAVIELPLAEATVISFSKTFFTTVLAIVILSEVVRVHRWTALVVGFVGVLIIVWPEQGSSISLWHLMALASATCVSLVMIVIRILAQTDRPVTIMTYQAVGVGVLMIPPLFWVWKTPEGVEWLLLLAIGVISAAAQYLNILAMKAGEASAMAPLEYTRLVFAAALGLWLFAEWPDPRVWAGAGVIILAALYMVYRERRIPQRDAANEPGG